MKVFFSFLMSIMFCSAAMGQFGILKKIQKQTEEKVAEKIVEKTVDGLFRKMMGSDTISSDSLSTDTTQAKKRENGLSGLFATKTIEKTFDFDVTLEMDMVTTDKKGKKESMYLTTRYNKNMPIISTSIENITNILDFSDMNNYVITNDEVTLMNLSRMMKKYEETPENEKDKGEMTLTGKKKKILGYNCEEVIYKDDEVEGSYWVTQELGLDPEIFAKTFVSHPSFKMPKKSKGVILEMKVVDLDNNTEVEMFTNKVLLNKVTYDLSKYKTRDLSRFKF